MLGRPDSAACDVHFFLNITPGRNAPSERKVGTTAREQACSVSCPTLSRNDRHDIIPCRVSGGGHALEECDRRPNSWILRGPRRDKRG